MKTSTRLKPSTKPFVYGGLISIASALCFAHYGFEGPLTGDEGNLVYSGQQMAREAPPYVSIFNHIGPLPSLIAGASIGAANFFNTGDLIIIRADFFIIAILTGVAVYMLASFLFESHAVGALSALAFLGFQCFGEDAVSGPRAKVPVILFQAMALLFAARRLQHLNAYDPSVIAVGPTSGRFSGRLFEWLRSRYTERAVVGWTLYTKEPQAARQQ